MPTSPRPSTSNTLLHALARRRLLIGYLVLLALSHLTIRLTAPSDPPPPPTSIAIPAMADDGPVDDGRATDLAYTHHAATNPAVDRAPVILIHGSPGGKHNFFALGPAIADLGYDAYALDMPGFGESTPLVPSYSILAQAHATLAFMDAKGIERAHIVGWSNGGGVALHMADMQPDRLASLTMLAAIGLQEAEGSGSYHFEHAKYAAGWGLFIALPEAIPHFGLLGGGDGRRAFIRSFWDSDQRPLRAIMSEVDVPVFIVHGRRDPLIPDWAAERHHELIPTSSLVMLDAMHFMPFTMPEETAGILEPFFARHDAPGTAPLLTTDDRAPTRPLIPGVTDRIANVMIDTPWWVLLVVVALAAMVSEYLALAILGLLLPTYLVDFFVAYLGLLLGQGGRNVWRLSRSGAPPGMETSGAGIGDRPRDDTPAARGPIRAGIAAALREHHHLPTGHALFGAYGIRAVIAYLLAVIVRMGAFLMLVWILVPMIARPPMYPLGLFGALLALTTGYLAVRILDNALTWTGRQRIRARINRVIHYEFWPALIFYAPLVPYLVYLALKHRHPLVFTCCNAGIGAGGGVVGESKSQIMERLMRTSSEASATFLVPDGGTPAERAAIARKLIDEHDAIGSLPLVIKPDCGQRGYGVRVIKSLDELEPYFESMTREAILQPYVEGPCEVGIVWARRPSSTVEPKPDTNAPGFVFSITRKEFPFLEGDGVRTIEELILSHPRYRCQAFTYLERFADQRRRVPADGEQIRLAVSGNHCQGTLFRDGADLITPELEAALDRIALAYPSDNGAAHGLDIGRFDIRYRSDDELRDGRGLSIIELNGTLGETTNIYDPDRSLGWAYGYLFRQWKLLYELGAQRRKDGAKPMTVVALLKAVVSHYGDRPSMEIAD